MSSGLRTFLALAGLASLLAPSTALGLQCHVGTITRHDNGAIRSCEIEAHHQFVIAEERSIACRAGHLLTQHSDGALRSCTLNKPYDDGQHSCVAGKTARLAPDGSLTGCQ